jgi:hypothetical protein
MASSNKKDGGTARVTPRGMGRSQKDRLDRRAQINQSKGVLPGDKDRAKAEEEGETEGVLDSGSGTDSTTVGGFEDDKQGDAGKSNPKK